MVTKPWRRLKLWTKPKTCGPWEKNCQVKNIAKLKLEISKGDSGQQCHQIEFALRTRTSLSLRSSQTLGCVILDTRSWASKRGWSSRTWMHCLKKPNPSWWSHQTKQHSSNIIIGYLNLRNKHLKLKVERKVVPMQIDHLLSSITITQFQTNSPAFIYA